jgi:lipooligosaccharide transport system permease protein
MSLEVPSRTTELPPRPSQVELTLRAFHAWLANYRRTWRGTAISTVLEPLGFLTAMGLGLGLLVDRNTGGDALGGTGYLEFLAPGLLAATAMQTVSFESTYPVLGAIKWQKGYHAALASPLRVIDVLTGHLLFILMRVTTTVAVFLVITAMFGAMDLTRALFVLPAGVLTGFAFAPAIFAFSATRTSDSGFAMLFRFGITPMFLFSGTFFPIDQLPDWMEPLAWVVPLWHGVDLCRDLALGQAELLTSLVHVGYLLAWVVGGFVVAYRCFQQRLVT